MFLKTFFQKFIHKQEIQKKDRCNNCLELSKDRFATYAILRILCVKIYMFDAPFKMLDYEFECR